MSAFTHGFNHGFAAGILNRMLGGFNMFSFNCWNSAPMFFTPNYNFNNFVQYPSVTETMPSIWTQNVPDFTNVENNWNLTDSTGIQQNWASFGGNLNQTNWQTNGFNFNTDFPTMKFSNIGWGDRFTRTSGVSQNSSKRTGARAKNWSKMTDAEMKQIYGNYTRDITKKYTGTANDLNKYLKGKGKLEGKGQAFIDAQNKYGISASVLLAICLNESGQGKSKLAKNKNNVGGVRISGSNEFRKFTSIEECINYMGSFLKNSYVNNNGKSLTKLYQINAKYCPASDTTDKAGTNTCWAKNVDKYTREIESAKA